MHSSMALPTGIAYINDRGYTWAPDTSVATMRKISQTVSCLCHECTICCHVT